MKKQEPIDYKALRLKAAEDAIAKLGGNTEAARKVGAPTRQSVQTWRKTGIPPRYCIRVSELTGMTLQELRPGDWQDYWPQSN